MMWPCRKVARIAVQRIAAPVMKHQCRQMSPGEIAKLRMYLQMEAGDHNAVAIPGPRDVATTGSRDVATVSGRELAPTNMSTMALAPANTTPTPVIEEPDDEPTKPIEKLLDIREVVDRKPSMAKSKVRPTGDKQNLIRVDCVEANVTTKTTTRDNCPTDVIHEESDGHICGSVDYSMSTNIGVPRVMFRENHIKSFAITDKLHTRMTRVNQPINMVAGQGRGNILLSLNVTTLLTNNALFKQLRARYTLFRFDMRFVLVPTFNSSALGSVIMMWVPLNSIPTIDGPSLVNNFGVYQHVWLQAASDESAILEVKFPTPANFFDNTTFPGTASQTLVMGNLIIAVGHPLQVPAGVSSTLPFELHMQMVNIRAAYPMAPLYTTQGLIDVNTNVYKDIKNSTMPQMIAGDTFQAPINLGLDHPGNTANYDSMIRRTYPKVNNTKGLLDVVRTTLNAGDGSYNKVTGADEMSFAYLGSCQAIVDSFAITTATSRGSLVSVIPLVPTGNPTNIHHMLSTFVRGIVYDSVDVTFRIPKAAYQTGKLVCVLTQGLRDGNFNCINSVPNTLTLSYDMLALPSSVIDLNSCDFEHTINVPWHAITEYYAGFADYGQPGLGHSYYASNTTVYNTTPVYSIPILAVYCLLPPGTSPNVANNINVVVAMSYNGYRGVYGHAPAMVPNYLTYAKSTAMKVATHVPHLKNIDDVISLRQLWQQPHYTCAYQLTTQESVINLNWANVITTFPMARMYAYVQGSVRFLIMLSKWNADFITIGVVDGQASNTPMLSYLPRDTMGSFLNSTTTPPPVTGPWDSTLYNPDWKGSASIQTPIFVEKNSPYVIVEVPIVRPHGVMRISNEVYNLSFMFSGAGITDEKFIHASIFQMAGDDFRCTHIRGAPATISSDQLAGGAMPPWNF